MVFYGLGVSDPGMIGMTSTHTWYEITRFSASQSKSMVILGACSERRRRTRRYETPVLSKPPSLEISTLGERARQILRPILLRRTKGSMLEGEPILKLPPKDIAIVNLKFSEEEREVF